MRSSVTKSTPIVKRWLSTVWISRPIICSIIPPGAFDFIDGEYAASLLSEKGSTAVIRLTPLRIQSAVGQIDVEVDTARSLPTAVIYEIDGDRVRIDIRSVTVHEASPRTFDAENYAGYEWIDFR